jgi:PAS domain S-box-containing protein
VEPSGQTILVVEDSAIQAELLRRFLADENYSPLFAADGAKGLEAIRARRPDLILADIAMPVMNGFELCRAVKDNPSLRGIPIILLTSLTDPRDLLEGLAAGADAYVFKPFEENDLREKLRRFLTAAEHEAPTQEEPVTFEFFGNRYRIGADRPRILEFLITVYDNALRQNRELTDMQVKLQEANEAIGVRRNEVELSRARYKALLHNTKTGFFRLSSEGRFLEANPALADMLGYASEEELLQVDAMDNFFVTSGRFNALKESLEKTDSVAGVIEQLHRKDRSTITIEANIRKAINESDATLYYEAFVNDITERSKAEAMIEQLNSKLSLILESVDEGILTLDTEGKHLVVNQAAAKMLGYEITELVGLDSHAAWHHTKADGTPYPAEECPISEIMRDGQILRRDDEVFWRKDRTSFPVEYTASPLRRDDTIVGAVIAFRDTTRRKEAEAEIQSLNKGLEAKIVRRTKELLDAQEQLVRKEKLSVLGQLAGVVGHELRNPLGVMNNAVYFLQSVLPDADNTVKEYLGIIKNEIDNADRIVGDLLDSVRTKPPSPQAVNVRDLIGQSLSKCVVPGTVKVGLIFPETLPAARVDPLQMQQVFRNLITNAIEAMPEGGALEITAADDAQAKTVSVSVKDTGIGIAPESVSKLFQPLFTTKTRGIGLGLVVVKNLTQANNGTVDVHSEPGKGTAFTVVLPAA